jgi:transposase-like protein
MAAPRKTNTDTDRKVAEAYARGDSVASISAEFGVSAGTVRSIVLREGGSLRPVGRPKAQV